MDQFFTWGTLGRSPRGERGLKWNGIKGAFKPNMSFPSRGTWIEILFYVPIDKYTIVVPLAGNVD